MITDSSFSIQHARLSGLDTNRKCVQPTPSDHDTYSSGKIRNGFVIMDKQMKSTRQTSRIFNPRIISLAIMFYIIISINQSFMTAIIGGSDSRLKFRGFIGSDSPSQYSNNNNLSKERSLITLVAAVPGPKPAAASARSAASTSHRVPPINGSIFGKRSLNGSQAKKSSRFSEQGSKLSAEESSNNDSLSEFLLKQKPIGDAGNGKSAPHKYEDIITELIEDFMAKNDKNSPEQTSAAFCRMIIYECNQFLKHRANRHSSEEIG